MHTMNFIDHFRLTVPRQKTLSQRDLKTDRDLNNKTWRKDKPMFEDIFDMFRLNWRKFQSSQEVLEHGFFSYSLFFMEVI